MYRVLFFIIFSIFITACGSSSTTKFEYNEYKTAEQNSDDVENSPGVEAQNAIRQIPQISEEQKQEFLDAVNSARADTQDCGSEGVFPPAPALTWSDELYKAAYEHTRDMALHGVIEHEGSNTNSDWTAQDLKLGRGSHFYERIEHNGYTNYKIVEENVAGGTYFNSASDVVEAWLKSDGHCANLMNKDVTQIGMAHVKKSTKYTNYWSQEFGAKH